jgi:hypothetical protein
MLLAKVSNGAVIAYPYSFAQLRRDYPSVSFPETLTTADLSSFGAVIVTRTGRPADQPGVVVVEAMPERVGGEWQQSWTVHAETPAELAEAKAQALREVDAAAEAARLRFITPGAGQSLEYAATEAEAREYIARPTNDPEDWPWLNAERVAAGGTSTILQVAQQVLEMAAAWRSVGSEIKRTRRTAKIAIESATSVLSVREVVSALDWPSPG